MALIIAPITAMTVSEFCVALHSLMPQLELSMPIYKLTRITQNNASVTIIDTVARTRSDRPCVSSGVGGADAYSRLDLRFFAIQRVIGSIMYTYRIRAEPASIAARLVDVSTP